MSEVDNLINRYLLDEEVAVFMEKQEALLAAKDAEITGLRQDFEACKAGAKLAEQVHRDYAIEKHGEVASLKRRVSCHQKGEAVKHICRDCLRNFWNVDDEPIICPFCGSNEMPIVDPDATKIL